MGRTQLQDWVSSGGAGQFVVGGDGAHLTLNTFNPTGSSFYGTQAKTLGSFQPVGTSTVVLNASLRLTTVTPGLVYGVYFYGCASAVTCAAQHDEVDIELVTNSLQPDAPLKVLLNSYANEPLGAGNSQLISLPAGFDPLVVHNWTIRWSLASVEYLVDGISLLKTFTHVPQGPMQAEIIAWAPASDFAEAYSAALQPAASAGQNQQFTALVSSLGVTVDPLPNVSITEYSTPAGFANLEGITSGPDQALWFAESSTGKIGRITVSGAVTEYPTVAGPWHIALGPDGTMWFTQGSETYGVGRISPSGAVTNYPVGGLPNGIVTGPDGALWFTESSGNKIGRLTTSGLLTEYPIPTSNSYPRGIASGPDGALWFVENSANKIGRISTAGTITEFAVSRIGIGDIAAGSDGALWFTSYYGNYLERITTAGVISEFPISGASTGNLFGLTSGPDGALWFTIGGSEIGRMTNSGVSTRYSVPTSNSNPVSITTGPDGAIWFTENATGKIGKAVIGGAAPGGLTITTSTLSAGTTGSSYSRAFTVSGGTAPYAWSFISGSLPPGMAFSNGGILSGTPTVPGTYTFVVGVSDATSASVTQTLTITVNPASTPLSISTTSPLLNAVSGSAYSQALVATGGTAPYAWSLTSGSLPSGLALSSAGVISGTPPSTGNATFTVRVTDAASNSISQTYTLAVVATGTPVRAGAISHFAAGGGWSTVISLVNTSGAPVAMTVVLHADNGTPLTIPVTTTQQGSVQTVTSSSVSAVLNPNVTLYIAVGDQLATTVAGWADVTSTGAVSGFAIFRWTPASGPPSEGTVPLQTQFTSAILQPYDNTNGSVTGIALANASGSSATVTATFWDENGGQLGSSAFSLAANGHTTIILPDQFPVTRGTRGIIRFQSSGSGISGIGLRFNPLGSFTSLPVIPSQ
ncbi:MAG: putative Ig domain-containing protein [Acidobacteriota bacterium]